MSITSRVRRTLNAARRRFGFAQRRATAKRFLSIVFDMPHGGSLLAGRPRVYLHREWRHAVWDTYETDPPLRYVPYVRAELCHWVSPYWLTELERAGRYTGYLRKPHILEMEHPFILAGGEVEDWARVRSSKREISARIRRSECRRVITFSAGLVSHFKMFVDSDLWHKLDYVYPAYPPQAPTPKVKRNVFRLLTIASRYSDKGVPEVIDAFITLRDRYGSQVELDLVCQSLPDGLQLPSGVTHYNVPRLTRSLKEQLYRNADVFVLPCYSETAACFTEAYAFGLPVITSRIHHGDEFVEHGSSGFLIPVPLFPYSEGFGREWRHWDTFLQELASLRQRGGLTGVSENIVLRVEELMDSELLTDRMAARARAFHQERFSPEARNAKLLSIYNAALTEHTAR